METKIKKLIERLPDIKRDLEKGLGEELYIDVEAGDCGNFAKALGEVLEPNKKHRYACSYESEYDFQYGQPAHCGIIIDDKFIDIRGVKSLEDAKWCLRERAVIETPPNYDDIVVDLGEDYMEFDEEFAEQQFHKIYDEENVQILEKVIKKYIE